MGDVVQPISMEHLLASVAPPDQCFYYAHPRGEHVSKGYSIGYFYGKDEKKVIALSTDKAWMVNMFKAFIIGGGGIFSDKHAPLFMDEFAEALTVPIIVMGVGANYHAKEYSTLLRKAVFVSGRDTPSIERFASILNSTATPATRPGNVRLVRDPVLSDMELTDTNGDCWMQSQDRPGNEPQGLCFVLPAANTKVAIRNHKLFKKKLVKWGDQLINVFPKHQAEIEQFNYPTPVQEIVNPMQFAKRLCSCKAIISTRFHGVILGFHMGVPTFGALHVDSQNKVAELVIDTMSLPDQFFLIDENLSREEVDRRVDTVRQLYDEGRRGAIHDKLSLFNEEFLDEARHMFDAVGIARRETHGGYRVSIGDSTWQPHVIAILLLLTIFGLASMPSTAGGGRRGSRQGLRDSAAVDGDNVPASNGEQDKRADHFCVQQKVDVRSRMSPKKSVRSQISAPTMSETPPSRPLLGHHDIPKEDKPSDVVFAMNFVLWIALAVAFSSYSKSYLRDTHDPVGLLALQGVSGSLVLYCLRRFGVGANHASGKSHGQEGQLMQMMGASPRETLVAVLHSGQAFLTNFSLFIGGVAVTNALKAMEPVVAGVFSYLLLGKHVASGGMAALAITITGILVLTSGGAGSGDRHSSSRVLLSAAFTMAAVSCNALRNVVIKKGDPIPPHRTLFTCSVAAGLIGVTLMLLRLVTRSMDEFLLGGGENAASGVEHGAAQYGSWLSMDGVNAAICFVGYNFASFNLLARLSPVGHAVGNSLKRVVMFGSGIVLMGEVMTERQLVGAGLALVGVGVYNVAEQAPLTDGGLHALAADPPQRLGVWQLPVGASLAQVADDSQEQLEVMERHAAPAARYFLLGNRVAPAMAGVVTEGQPAADEAQDYQHVVVDKLRREQVSARKRGNFADVRDCILLFGAFCNGNMGDVVQHISMEHILSSVAPTDQCFYYAHHRGENSSKGFRIGEFFGGDRSKLIKISSQTAWKVNRFKAFVIGGGGIFADKHAPLFQYMFVEALTVPIVIMGVGANYRAKEYSALLRKAAFVSARDPTSIGRFADILSDVASPTVPPDDIRLVRDPVLCDKSLTDTTGACWRQSAGDHEQPLCFVLPAANTRDTMKMHQELRARVVRQGDRFINVFPKHQEEFAKFRYPGTVEEILDPTEYAQQLCSCKAIISTRFHGAILGLHMGVPTFGAFHFAAGNKVPDLMIDTMSLPDQFFLIDGKLTREIVDRQVAAVRRSYKHEGRRGAIHDRLSVFNEEFQAKARKMLSVVGITPLQPEQQTPTAQPQVALGDGAWEPQKDTAESAAGEPHVQGSPEDGGNTTAMATSTATATAMAAAATVISAADAPAPTMKTTSSNTPLSPAKGGHHIIVAVVLLFTITGLASLPSTAGRTGHRSYQRRLALGNKLAKGASKLPNLVFAMNFVLWIALAVAFSSYSKSYLRDTHDPVGLLALQGVSGSLVLYCLGRFGVGANHASSKSHGAEGQHLQVMGASPRETLVAVLHSGQAFLTNFSLFVGGVAVTNALKAMEPVVAGVFSYLLLGKRVASGGIMALAITVTGLLVLTSGGTSGGDTKDVGEATNTGGGGRRVLLSAAFTMAAVSCNSLRNVVLKKGDPIPPHRTLITCSVAAGTIGVTVLVVRCVISRIMDALLISGENGAAGVEHGAAQYGSWLSMDGVNAALCFVGYNFASFNLLARLSPVGHAVGNSVKRVVMFGSGIVLMDEVMTARQLVGAAVALVGVGMYNVEGLPFV
eukprot:g10617.t1